uniref:geranylgeranyl transferase type-2 subunit alpha-like n=1 Tax=Styela clava TaxID=7725 RepID=UPI00193A1072|nr:geranylgeranyl transferase type-2 subunit alpha-like [Styela clava]
MHGRLKVKTTAEQDAEKKKEREKKLKLFQKATSVAHEKITKQEYDSTGLHVSQQILSSNSDYSSMWNYRKAVFNSMKDKEAEELQKLCNDELEFLASCLRNNPKSYGCWHHRCFIMLYMPHPDWKKELDLCNQFLQFDDRNFHCWDYRRFVVKNSVPNVSVDDEIKCTDKLVENNFSNYSSWHYRSKLLPIRYPSSKNPDRIAEDKLLQELEFVQNAFFTDPNDQSAWFYHRWLLGRGQTMQGIIAVHVQKATSSVTCIFRKPINITDIKVKCSVVIDDITQSGSWNSLSGNGYQHAWIFKCSNDLTDKSCDIVVKCSDESFSTSFKDTDSFSSNTITVKDEFRQELSSAKLELLESELESCTQLNDLEPGNKWAVLTLVLLMRAIGPQKYQVETDKYLTDLQSIDDKRKEYYADLRSKYVIEDCINGLTQKQSSVDLSKKILSRVCHLQYFSGITIFNISSNQLRKLNGPFHLLICCESIIADDNKIDDISGIKNMQRLVTISLSGNSLCQASSLQVLSSCPKLKNLNLQNNKFQDEAETVQKVLTDVNIQL